MPARPSNDALLRVGIYDGSTIEPAPAPSDRGSSLGASVSDVSRDEYEEALASIARSLIEGDVYQINYTVPFRSRVASDPHDLFEDLVRTARVPYAALVEAAGRAYVSLSPELFLAIDGDVVRTRPMKGTASPGDAAVLGNAKNRAEHVMIVDLLRNDLHRVCSDVRVEAFETIETYPTFATMTSTIAGRLRLGTGLEALFAATFPCGSVTGAPKRSAMRRIFELEGAARGVAMGSIGYLEPRPDGRRRGWWNVAIRTLTLDRTNGSAELRVGGGIVADSTPLAEWNEIGVKRRLFRSREPVVGLIETLLVRDGEIDYEPHARRLAESAWRFGIAFDALDLRRRAHEVAAYVSHGPAAMPRALLRIHLASDGTATLTTRAFEAAPQTPQLCIAAERLDADDPLLRYKTDLRAVYDVALAEATRRGCFEAVLLNTAGAVADGARTSLFFVEPDGRLATPRLEDGALDGIERHRLLQSGVAFERRIDEQELVTGIRVRLASSTRGMLGARLT